VKTNIENLYQHGVVKPTIWWQEREHEAKQGHDLSKKTCRPKRKTSLFALWIRPVIKDQKHSFRFLLSSSCEKCIQHIQKLKRMDHSCDLGVDGCEGVDLTQLLQGWGPLAVCFEFIVLKRRSIV